MRIPSFIKHIPTHFHNTWKRIARVKPAAKNWTVQRLEVSRNYWNQEWWQPHVKPFYELKIKRLDKTDLVTLAGSLVAAAAVMALAIEFFIALFPIVMGADALLVLGACSHSQDRIRHKFNKEAWKHVNEIRKIANDITSKNQKFSEIENQRALLNKPEFAHLESDLKQLDNRIQKFSTVALAPYYEEKQKVVSAHLAFLKNLVSSHAQDKGIIEAFEQEVNLIGTQAQNLESFETKKQKLAELQTPAALSHLNSLNQQLDDLVKTAQRPRFMDNKIAFIKYLEELMRKLDPQAPIDPLVPRGPLDIIASPPPPPQPPVETEQKKPPIEQPPAPPQTQVQPNLAIAEQPKPLHQFLVEEQNQQGTDSHHGANIEVQVEEQKA
jgi:hypothetical protein